MNWQAWGGREYGLCQNFLLLSYVAVVTSLLFLALHFCQKKGLFCFVLASLDAPSHATEYYCFGSKQGRNEAAEPIKVKSMSHFAFVIVMLWLCLFLPYPILPLNIFHWGIVANLITYCIHLFELWFIFCFGTIHKRDCCWWCSDHHAVLVIELGPPAYKPCTQFLEQSPLNQWMIVF